jgi:hypothetical protein
MPIAVARKIEFLVRKSGEELDIQLVPIILTADQVRQFQLPKIPIREEVKGKARFEEQHGEGAVELDALEALHPGELRRIINRAIDRWRDDLLPDRIGRVARRVRGGLDEIRDGIIEQHSESIDALQSEWESAQEQVQEHQDAIARILDDLRESAEPIVQAIAGDLEAALPDLDEIEWPEPKPAKEVDDPLYDSTRDYLTQVERFRRHQGKPNGSGGES